jgi:macrolide-specific efflux system membrane fusion protein
MTATIDIGALEAEDVLLVPSQAIKTSGADLIVEVVISDGETEERVVETGASNGVQTEIVSGLVEGEQVVVQTSSEQADTSNQLPQRMPGMGGGGIGGKMPR